MDELCCLIITNLFYNVFYIHKRLPCQAKTNHPKPETLKNAAIILSKPVYSRFWFHKDTFWLRALNRYEMPAALRGTLSMQGVGYNPAQVHLFS